MYYFKSYNISLNGAKWKKSVQNLGGTHPTIFFIFSFIMNVHVFCLLFGFAFTVVVSHVFHFYIFLVDEAGMQAQADRTHGSILLN